MNVDLPAESSLFLTISASFLTGLAILAVVFALRNLMARDVQVRSRLTTFLDSQDDGADFEPSRREQFATRLNETIARQSFADQIARGLERANLPITVAEYILLRIAVPLVLSVFALLIWRSLPAMLLGILIGAILPIFWLQARQRQRNQAFDEQLAETLQMMASSLRGGFSMLQALRHVAKESQEPTKTELNRVVQEVQLGLNVNDALANLARRVESEDLEMVVTAMQIHSRIGGNLTHILETISATIRERSRLRREVRVITSMQRLSAYLIGALPFLLTGVIFAINPTYMSRLFVPGWTLCIPIGAFIMAVMGFFIIRRVADIKI